VTCDTLNGASFTLVPYDGFTGSVYMLDSNDNFAKKPLCTLNFNDPEYSRTDYPYDVSPDPTNCPIAEATTSPEAYNFYVYIQYDANMFTGKDIVVKFTCAKLPDGTFESYTSTLNANNELGDTRDSSVSGDIPSGVSAEVMLAGSIHDTSTPVSVGTVIDLTYSLDTSATTAHDDMSLKELSATNFAPTDANLASIPIGGQVTIIIAEWCVSSGTSQFTVSLTKILDGTELSIVYSFAAFFYAVNPTVYNGIYFEATFCLGSCLKNNAPTAACGAGHLTGDDIADTLAAAATPSGRRRRNVNNEDVEEVNFRLRLNVQDATSKQSEHVDTRKNDEYCFSMMTFLAPLLTLTFLLITALMLTFMFYRKLQLNKQKE